MAAAGASTAAVPANATAPPPQAYTEILNDERKETAVGLFQRAHAYFTDCGITMQRILTDNGGCYKSFLWREALTAAAITHKRTRPYRPQTNGEVERFHRNLADEWAYARPTPAKPNDDKPLHPGCTRTTITAATPHSAASHPPAA
jgi:transposase InsO family protein